MHEKKRIICVKTPTVFMKKMLITGIVLIFLFWCAGCGKKETALFLEETVMQEEQNSSEESRKECEEEQDFGEEDTTEQTVNGTAAGTCFVHICGAVNHPGVYELPEESRIFEVVELAGGLTEEACGEYQNQAQKITDGMKIYIPTAEELENEEEEEQFWKEETKTTEAIQDANKAVNINTADKELLMTLPGIGESRAESIISYRDTCGGFTKTEDIMQVSGIKQGAYEKLKDRIYVD